MFSDEPKDIDYRKQPNGYAEVWVYRNIKQTEEGWEAEGVFFETMLSEEEVCAQKNTYFNTEDQLTESERIKELEAQNEMLTECIIELANIIYA